MIEKIKELEKISRLLDPGDEIRASWNDLVTSHTADFLNELDEAKAYYKTDKQGKGILDFPPEEGSNTMDQLLAEIRESIEEEGINPASGGHMGFIPGGGLYPSALGDYLTAISNKYAGIYFSAPGAVRLENMLLKWMGSLMGFPKSAGGNLTSGGSISILIAIVSAREASEVKARDFDKLVVYLSDQTHHSIQKALRIAGLGEAQVRHLPLDHELRLQTEGLEELIIEDKKNGLIPFFMNGSLGTTNTGTVDPINTMVEVAKKHSIWFHVDAAYGGFFKLVESAQKKFNGVEKADSITLDPHKSLFLPFGTGAVLIKNVEALYKGHRYTSDYMQDLLDGEGEANPADVSPELTKHFRGLRLWLPLKLFGLKPFRAALEEKLMLANYFHEQIQQIPGFIAGPKPDLSVAIFRYLPENGNANSFNEKLIKAIQEDGRIFLSSTNINGEFWIRVAVVIFRTHLYHIDLLLEILKVESKRIATEN